jgi:hypothetical protein
MGPRLSTSWRRGTGIVCATWQKHRTILLGLAVALAASATLRTLLGFKHLLFGGANFDFNGGDLKYRQAEVMAWFNGEPVYGVIRSAVYPPASHVMFWPFVGWLDASVLLWVWAFIYAALLIWLTRQTMHASGVQSGLARVWVALIPLSMYATARSIEVGQVILVILPTLIAGVYLLRQPSPTFMRDLLGSALVILALIKPTTSIPLVLIAFLAVGRLRPAVLITAGYAGITGLAALFQPQNAMQLMRAWLAQDGRVRVHQTSANLHKLLADLGLADWLLPAAFLVLSATALWVWRNRSADLWLLLGVTGLVSRLWMYHRPFDDLLLLLPAIALLRVAADRTAGDAVRAPAGMLLGLTWLSTIVSRIPLREYPNLQQLLDGFQGLTWLAVLAFLLWEVRRTAHQRVTLSASPVPNQLVTT